jgi:hypothetical protein
MTTPPLQKWFLLAICYIRIIGASHGRVNAENGGSAISRSPPPTLGGLRPWRMPGRKKGNGMAKERVTRRQKDISRLLREQKKTGKPKPLRPKKKK